MKQVIQNMRSGELRVEDVPAPAVRPGGLLVKVERSLISPGTERMVIELGKKSLLGKARERPDLVRKLLAKVQQEGIRATFRKAMVKLDTPIPLGYSCAGTVAAVGEGVVGWAPGDRVACAGQGYASHAEYVYVPKNLCVRIPEGVPSDGAAFVTLGAIAMQGVRVAEVSLGERVGVIGLGLLGQLTVQILKAAGCRVAGIDLDPAKVSLAREMGADFAISRAEEGLENRLMAWTGGRGLDRVLITAATKSSDPVSLAGELCRDKGVVTVVGAVGMEVPRRPFYDKELSLRLSRSYGPGRYDRQYEEKGIDYPFGYVRWTEQRNMESFLELVEAGRMKVEPLITHRYPVAKARSAYQEVTGSGSTLAVLLEYSGQAEPRRRVDLKAASAPRRDQIRIGLIGAGDFAKGVLVPALQDLSGVELRAVVTATGLSAAQTGRQVGAAYVATDYTEVISDPDIDAVVIATRHNLHAEIVIAALEAGKAVFVEKPLALNEDELRRVAAAAEPSGRTLMVGFNRRFAPIVQEIRKHICGRGPLLMHYRVNAGALPQGHWTQDLQEGGGRILGEVCHFVDLLQYLAGSLPEEVFAAVAGAPGSAANDNLALTLRFADGSVGQIVYASGGSPLLPKERLEISGGGRSAVLDDFHTGIVYLESRQLKVGGRTQDKGHRGEVAAWIAALKAGQPSPIALEHLLATTKATFAVERSLATGRLEPIS